MMSRGIPYNNVLYGIFIFILTLLAPGFEKALAEQYQAVPGLIDLRTTFSDGAYSVDGLVQLAKSKGFHVLFLNDHDRMAMEYGIFPLRNLLKKRVELNSINLQGADKFLQAIREAEKRHPEMIIVPGSETAPFYYWSGSFLKGNLTAHNPERRILTIGMDKPGDYNKLPILHNDVSLNMVHLFSPVCIIFSIAFAASFFMVLFWKGILRLIGVVILIFSFLFIMNTLLSDSSPFDPYHGDQGIAPYQSVIDYVSSRGGLTFWNYPETKSGIRKMGPITVSTPPYPGVLGDSKGYTGFSVLYGENITVTEPGNIWDLTLKEYCRGLRKRPPWGIATSDFHKEGESGEKLGNFQTVFFLKEKTKAQILDALKKGRMYACQGSYPKIPRLDSFFVSSTQGTEPGISGDEIMLTGNPVIHISLSMESPSSKPVKVRIIRSGALIKMIESPLPLKITFEDSYFNPGEKVYYRMDMRGAGIVVSNPIFVKFEQPK